jgi:Zn-dependent protease with chaperone function
MRWLNLTILGLAMAGTARGEDITDVLRRSQQVRLEAMVPATDAARAQAIRHSFETLHHALDADAKAELRVVSTGPLAETLHGHIVVANEALADLPEGERLFILAHELGHVAAGHWAQMQQLYQRWIPGAVTQDKTDPVAALLGRDASGLAHRHEFAADAYALQAMRNLGWDPRHAFAAFSRQGLQFDTATHPGTRKRIASLRAVQAQVASPSSGIAE